MKILQLSVVLISLLIISCTEPSTPGDGTDPGSGTHPGPFILGSNTLSGIDVIKDGASITVYAAAQDEGVYVVDATDADNPVITDTVFATVGVTDLYINDVVIYNNYMFLCEWYNIYSAPLSDLTSITITGTGNQPKDINFLNNKLFVANYALGIKRFDVSALPAFSDDGDDTLPSNNSSYEIIADSVYAFVAANTGKLHIVEYKAMTDSVDIATIDFGSGLIYDLYLDGNTLYMAYEGDTNSGVSIYNVTTPAVTIPAQLVFIDTVSRPTVLCFSGSNLIIGQADFDFFDPSSTISIYNVIDNPSNPLKVSDKVISGTIAGMKVVDGNIYAVSSGSGLHIIPMP